MIKAFLLTTTGENHDRVELGFVYLPACPQIHHAVSIHRFDTQVDQETYADVDVYKVTKINHVTGFKKQIGTATEFEFIDLEIWLEFLFTNQENAPAQSPDSP